MGHRATVIIGAGLSGLATAMHLNGDYLVIEREGRPGGLARTEEIDGFLFDYTGHWLHMRDERVKMLVAGLLPGGLRTVARRANIWIFRGFLPYPFQSNLFGLPDAVRRECLQGAVEAAVRRAGGKKTRLKSFSDFVRYHFGDGIARHFIVPYNTKLWGVSPDEITAEWTARFVPIPDIAEIVDGALGFSREGTGYNATFVYPVAGGIETLAKAMYERCDTSHFIFNTKPRRINLTARYIEFGEERLSFDRLVSSVPLPELVAMTEDAPASIRRAAHRLRCSVLRWINVGLDVERPLGGAHWVYLPEMKYPFYRVGSASNVSPALAPPGRASLYVELSNDRPVSERDVLQALGEFLKETGSIKSERQLLFAAFREHRYGYVIYDRHCTRVRDCILKWYAQRGVFSVGRYGAWNYSSMEDAILDGIDVAEHIKVS